MLPRKVRSNNFQQMCNLRRPVLPLRQVQWLLVFWVVGFDFARVCGQVLPDSTSR